MLQDMESVGIPTTPKQNRLVDMCNLVSDVPPSLENRPDKHNFNPVAMRKSCSTENISSSVNVATPVHVPISSTRTTSSPPIHHQLPPFRTFLHRLEASQGLQMILNEKFKVPPTPKSPPVYYTACTRPPETCVYHATTTNSHVSSYREPSSPRESTGIRRCFNCSTEQTPSWRRCGREPNKIIILCNACGLYFNEHGVHRPFRVGHDGKSRALRLARTGKTKQAMDGMRRQSIPQSNQGPDCAQSGDCNYCIATSHPII